MNCQAQNNEPLVRIAYQHNLCGCNVHSVQNQWSKMSLGDGPTMKALYGISGAPRAPATRPSCGACL